MQSCTVSVHARLHSERILFGTNFRVGDRNFTITSIEGSSGKFWEETSSMDGVRNSKSEHELERLMVWGKAEAGILLMGRGNSVDWGFLRKQQKQLGDGEKDFLIREHAGQNSLFQSSKYCEGTEPWNLPAQWSARWLCKEATFFQGLDKVFGHPGTGQLKDDFDCWPNLYFLGLLIVFLNGIFSSSQSDSESDSSESLVSGGYHPLLLLGPNRQR